MKVLLLFLWLLRNSGTAPEPLELYRCRKSNKTFTFKIGRAHV